MDEIGLNWFEMEFGHLPTGAVFRLLRDDEGLFIKGEAGALKTGNAMVIVSRFPGRPGCAQAGEAVKFHDGHRVCMLVLDR